MVTVEPFPFALVRVIVVAEGGELVEVVVCATDGVEDGVLETDVEDVVGTLEDEDEVDEVELAELVLEVDDVLDIDTGVELDEDVEDTDSVDEVVVLEDIVKRLNL